jgi:Mrp family chromosome partitioning ATPase
MSLLLKALSRVETKLSEPAAGPSVSPVQPSDEQIAPVDLASPPESPVSQETPAAPAIETPPEVTNQDEVSNTEIVAPTPAVDELTEDLPIAETIAAVDELGFSTDDALPMDDAASMYDEPPQTDDFHSYEFDVLSDSAADTHEAEKTSEESASEAPEPVWQQLDKLHDLLSAHIAEFDLSSPQSKSPPAVENTAAPSTEISSELPDAAVSEPPPAEPTTNNLESIVPPSIDEPSFAEPVADITEPDVPLMDDIKDSPELTLEFPESIVPALIELPPASEVKSPEPPPAVQEPVAPAKMPVVTPASVSPAPTVAPSAVKTHEPAARAAVVAQLNIKPEYRELRDQLLARMNTSRHSTVLFVDAGRTTCDATWLLPLATSIIERWNATRATGGSEILLVEAGGPQCGLSQTLGLETHVGLNHVLTGRADWRDAIQPTLHPQIQLLSRGAEQARCDDPKRLSKLWTDLSRQYDLILVAAGPISRNAHTRRAKPSNIDDAVQFFTPATAAVLCVELNGTSQTAALEAKRSLDARGIQVLGCIVQPN